MGVTRHLGLRDEYYNRLNKLIYEGTLTWQVEEGYPYGSKLRTYYFLEHILEKSERAFVDGAYDARTDADARAIVNKAAYERFCERIKSYVSEASLKRFTDYVDSTFLLTEIEWNTKRKTFRSLAEVLEELGVRRPRVPTDILGEEVAGTISNHIDALYLQNERARCVDVGRLYWTALQDLGPEVGLSETYWKSMYIWGGTIPIMLMNAGEDVDIGENPFYDERIPEWVQVHWALLCDNKWLLQNDISNRQNINSRASNLGTTVRWFCFARLMRRMREEPDSVEAPTRDYLSRMKPWLAYDNPEFPEPNETVVLSLLLMARACWVRYRPQGEYEHKAWGHYIDHALRPDLWWKTPQHLYDEFAKMRDGSAYGVYYAGLSRRWLGNNRIDQCQLMLDDCYDLLSRSRNAMAIAEYYVAASDYMHAVGNAALEARALRKAASLYKDGDAKTLALELEGKAHQADLEPLMPNLPDDRETYLRHARLLQREELFLDAPPPKTPSKRTGRPKKTQLSPARNE